MKKLFGLSETAAVMLAVTGCLFAVFLALGLLVSLLLYPFERPLPYALGLLTGCALSAAKVILMEKSLNRAVDYDSKFASLYATLQVALRYILTVAVFLCVFLFPDILGLFGAIIGVLCLQLSAYITSPILRHREKQREA